MAGRRRVGGWLGWLPRWWYLLWTSGFAFRCTLRIGDARVVYFRVFWRGVLFGGLRRWLDDDVMVGVFGCALWGAAGMGVEVESIGLSDGS